MLKLKPGCENCDCALPVDSTEARICSYECTFCSDCVEQVLNNVCPNCGGGFERRPVRPANAWVEGVSLTTHPAVEERTYKPVDTGKHGEFAAEIACIPAHKR